MNAALSDTIATDRVFNFSPGPATLPLEVLQQAQSDLLNWQHTGVSIMEMGHRDPRFIALADQVVDDLATLLALPESHTILYLHGGARTQFAMVPLNLGASYTHAHYANTGLWSSLAEAQAAKYLQTEIITTVTQNDAGHSVLQHHTPTNRDAVAYLHYTPNETVDGIFMPTPHTPLPLVADGTSTLLALPMDITAHDIIYASAQKNMGIAGITFVVVRRALLDQRQPMTSTPNMLQYHHHVAKKSMYNTPSTFSLYLSGLMFKWLLTQGGIAAMAQRHHTRSQKLYDIIDASHCYTNHIDPSVRSPINVTWHMRDPSMQSAFLAFAKQRGLDALKGHRAVGGLRASLYNGMPDAGVDALCQCLIDFENQQT